MRHATIYAEGLTFGENPRWHDGSLWVADLYRKQVLTVDADGRLEPVIEAPNQPSGFGWLPDGRLLVGSMLDRKLLRLDPGGLVEHADLSGIATWHLNDMVVDGEGRAYVGNYGFELEPYVAKHGREAVLTDTDLVTASITRVDPDGSVHIAASGLRFPNGTVITPDGATLIVAETFDPCLTAFDIAPDGTLSNRRVWAQFSKTVPTIVADGICLDAEGAVWVANPTATECVRVAEGGEILDRVVTSAPCYACTLGGPNRTTLFLVTNISGENRRGQIEFVNVDVAGTGSP